MSFKAAEVKTLLSILERHLPKLKPSGITFAISKRLISVADCLFYAELKSKIKACRAYLTLVESLSQTGEMVSRDNLTYKIDRIRDFLIEGDKNNRCYYALPSYYITFENAYVRTLKEVNARCDLLENTCVNRHEKIHKLSGQLGQNQRMFTELSKTYDQPNLAALQASIFARYYAEQAEASATNALK